jgi:hypothetical protein
MIKHFHHQQLSLTATNGKLMKMEIILPSSSSTFISNHSDISNPTWTTQMLFQQFGPFIQQQQALSTTTLTNNNGNINKNSSN